MKKIIFSTLLLAIVFTASSQEKVKVHNPNSPVSAREVPPNIRYTFETAYPGISVISWDPVNSWWRASYKDEARVIYVFYNDQAVNYRVSLPVLQNNVSEDIVNTALRVYGPVVYGITKIKAADNTEIYQVRLMESGVMRVTYMDSNGTAVTNNFKAADVVVIAQ